MSVLPDQPIGIFLSHVSEDKDKVRELNRQLQEGGFLTWFDEDSLLPGQTWDAEIQRSIRRAPLVIICISPHANAKVGYYQKEIKWALDRQDEQPEGGIFTIPVKLESCKIPDRLSGIQAANLYEDDGYTKVLKTLNGLPQDILAQIREDGVNTTKPGPLPEKVIKRTANPAISETNLKNEAKPPRKP